MTYNTQLGIACVSSVLIAVMLAGTLEKAWSERNARLVEMKEEMR